jgi:hypothetical protein
MRNSGAPIGVIGLRKRLLLLLLLLSVWTPVRMKTRILRILILLVTTSDGMRRWSTTWERIEYG